MPDTPTPPPFPMGTEWDAGGDVDTRVRDLADEQARLRQQLAQLEAVVMSHQHAEGTIRELHVQLADLVKLASKSAARRTILEHTGKLKSPLEGRISALARALLESGSRDESECPKP